MTAANLKAVKTFLGQNNIKKELSTIKLLRMQIFSKIQPLLKITAIGVLTLLGVKYPQGVQQLFWVKITPKMNSAPSNYSEYKFLKNRP